MIARPSSGTAKDRTYVHASNLPEGTKPVVAGGQFSTLAVLPEVCGSWTYVLDNRRIKSEQTQAQVAAQQLEAIVPLLAPEALLVGDGYYGSLTFLQATDDLPCDKLLRFAKNRVLYRPAPPRPQKPGRAAPKKDGRAAPKKDGRAAPKKDGRAAPKKDGPAFKCKDATPHGPPDASWEGEDADGHRVEVVVWHNLHFKQARAIGISLLGVTRHGAHDTKRDPRVSWFVFVGQTLPPLEEIAPLYARRYSPVRRPPWNTAFGWTSKTCCGKKHVCEGPHSSRIGQTSWPAREISCAWRERWRRPANPGKEKSAQRRLRRCVAPWEEFFGSWERPPVRPKYAENPPVANGER